jgi:hypothetical protein
MGYDPRNDPNVRLVGRRIGGQVPNLANANVKCHWRPGWS